MTLNFERNLKEKLKIDNSDYVINERTILLDSLEGRDGTYDEEELELIISDIEKSLACENFDDDKDDVSNEVEARDISRTIVKANDIMIEMKQTFANSPLFYKPAECNITSVRVNYDVRNIIPTSNAYTTHRAEITKIFEKFGSIKNIQFISMAARCFRKNGQLLQRISDHKLYTIRAFIDYHSPISAKRAFSMNGRRFEESYITVCYDSEVPAFLFNNRKCVYLSHLPRDIDNNTIWKLFNTCGEIEYVYLVRDEKLGYARGIGCVAFITEDAVRKALELNGTLVMGLPVIVKDFSMGQFWELNLTRSEKETTEIEKVLTKDKTKQNLPHKSNSNNPSKKFKKHFDEVAALVREAKTEKKKRESQKHNVDIVKNKPSTSFQGKTTNFEQKKKKKFNKQKKQMARKLAAKPNKPAKV